MKKLSKYFGAIGAVALAAVLTPYHIRFDKQTGSFELESVLWSVKKAVGTERDRYTIELLPFVGGKEEPAEDAEAPAEEPVAEEGSETASGPEQAET